MKYLLDHPRYGTHLRQGLKFVVSGGLGAMVDIGSLPILVQVLYVPSSIAFYLSSLLSVTVVFFINKHVTFKSRDAYLPQLIRFALVYGSTIVLNGLLSGFLFRYLIHYYLIAKALAIGVLIPVNYILSHAFIFKTRRQTEEAVL